jgi:hypothetical protein
MGVPSGDHGNTAKERQHCHRLAFGHPHPSLSAHSGLT